MDHHDNDATCQTVIPFQCTDFHNAQTACSV